MDFYMTGLLIRVAIVVLMIALLIAAGAFAAWRARGRGGAPRVLDSPDAWTVAGEARRVQAEPPVRRAA